jgi:hypothetical protein
MPRKVRSAKGEVVDFDLLKIKEQIASAPTPTEVKTRQDFIENRLKRRLKKKTAVVEKTEVDVEPKLPEPADGVEIEEAVLKEEASVEETVPVEEKKSSPKQRARKKKKPEETKEE